MEQFERLEKRTLLAAAPIFVSTVHVSLTDAGTLVVRGSNHAERVSIRLANFAKDDKIQIWLKRPSDTNKRGFEYALMGGGANASVNRIDAHFAGGDDKISIDFSDRVTTAIQIHGGAGNDHLIGDDGNEILAGGAGNDTIEASGGDDVLIGGRDRDSLSGGNGSDLLRGGGGQDFLNGDDGIDTVIGDEGSDLFLETFEDADLLLGGDGDQDRVLHTSESLRDFSIEENGPFQFES
jgi:Ca2+-binding RTX toxin-like protein